MWWMSLSGECSGCLIADCDVVGVGGRYVWKVCEVLGVRNCVCYKCIQQVCMRSELERFVCMR